MKKVLAGLAFVVMGSVAQADGLEQLPGNHWTQGGTVVVSCFRGPWREVIWDRPEGIFIDTLVEVGYDYPSALAIATRICRDLDYVNVPGAMKAEMERIIAEAPRD